jgi:hypothetical protein
MRAPPVYGQPAFSSARTETTSTTMMAINDEVMITPSVSIKSFMGNLPLFARFLFIMLPGDNSMTVLGYSEISRR